MEANLKILSQQRHLSKIYLKVSEGPLKEAKEKQLQNEERALQIFYQR